MPEQPAADHIFRQTPRTAILFYKSVSFGRFAYRLQKIDRDGKFEYSQSDEVMVSGTPTVFAMEQNYPNLFNHAITIIYQVPQDGITTLTVYDEAGRQVAVLVNEVKEAGYYTIVFDGKMKTKKLVLMK